MKFILEIELGNDAMQTYADIRGVLRMIAKRPASPKVGDGNDTSDDNGNVVGHWEIVD